MLFQAAPGLQLAIVVFFLLFTGIDISSTVQKVTIIDPGVLPQTIMIEISNGEIVH